MHCHAPTPPARTFAVEAQGSTSLSQLDGPAAYDAALAPAAPVHCHAHDPPLVCIQADSSLHVHRVTEYIMCAYL